MKKIFKSIIGLYLLSIMLLLASCMSEVHNVVFYNYDGSVYQSLNLSDGEALEAITPPTKEATNELEYKFVGWDCNHDGNADELPSTINESLNIYPVFESVERIYTVTFKSDGEDVEVLRVPYNYELNLYEFSASKENDEEIVFTFIGWDINGDKQTDSFIRVTKNIEANALFLESIGELLVSFYDDVDGNVISSQVVKYGEACEFKGEEPKKAPTLEHEFVFKGWDKKLDKVTRHTNVYPIYEKIDREYSIKFIDSDNSLYQEIKGKYNDEIKLEFENPADKQDELYTDKFIGWDINGDGKADTLPKVLDKNYEARALYEKERIKVEIKIYDYDNTLLVTSYIYKGQSFVLPLIENKQYNYRYEYIHNKSRYSEGSTISNVLENIEIHISRSIIDDNKPISRVYLVTIGLGEEKISEISWYDSLPFTSETKMGYTFEGYYTDREQKNRLTSIPEKGSENLYIYKTYKKGLAGCEMYLNEDNVYVLTKCSIREKNIYFPDEINGHRIGVIGSHLLMGNSYDYTSIHLPRNLDLIMMDAFAPDYSSASDLSNNIKEIHIANAKMIESYAINTPNTVICLEEETLNPRFAENWNGGNPYILDSTNTRKDQYRREFILINDIEYIINGNNLSIYNAWLTEETELKTFILIGEKKYKITEIEENAIGGTVLSVSFPKTIEVIKREGLKRLTNLRFFIVDRYIEKIGTNAFPNDIRVVVLGKTQEKCNKVFDYAWNNSTSVYYNYDEAYYKDEMLFGIKNNAADLIKIYRSSFDYLDLSYIYEFPIINILENSAKNLSLGSLIIGENVKSIGSNAFTSTSAAEVSVRSKDLAVKSDSFNLFTLNGVYLNFDKSDFVLVDNILIRSNLNNGKITIPSNVKFIAGFVFYGKSITEVDLNNVVTIGESAFSYMKSLVRVTNSSKLRRAMNNAFTSCEKLESIDVSNTYYLGRSSFENCSRLNNITIAGKNAIIRDHAFRGCSKLESLEFANDVEVIEEYAFEATMIRELNFNYKVKRIDPNAFYNNQYLEVVRFHHFENKLASLEDMTEIGSNAFSSCNKISKIVIGNRVRSIGDYAFGDAGDRLLSVHIPITTVKLGREVFKNASNLEIRVEADTKPYNWSNNFYTDKQKVTYGVKENSGNLFVQEIKLISAITEIEAGADYPYTQTKILVVYNSKDDNKKITSEVYCKKNMYVRPVKTIGSDYIDKEQEVEIRYGGKDVKYNVYVFDKEVNVTIDSSSSRNYEYFYMDSNGEEIPLEVGRGIVANYGDMLHIIARAKPSQKNYEILSWQQINRRAGKESIEEISKAEEILINVPNYDIRLKLNAREKVTTISKVNRSIEYEEGIVYIFNILGFDIDSFGRRDPHALDPKLGYSEYISIVSKDSFKPFVQASFEGNRLTISLSNITKGNEYTLELQKEYLYFEAENKGRTLDADSLSLKIAPNANTADTEYKIKPGTSEVVIKNREKFYEIANKPEGEHTVILGADDFNIKDINSSDRSLILRYPESNDVVFLKNCSIILDSSTNNYNFNFSNEINSSDFEEMFEDMHINTYAKSSNNYIYYDNDEEYDRLNKLTSEERRRVKVRIPNDGHALDFYSGIDMVYIRNSSLEVIVLSLLHDGDDKPYIDKDYAVLTCSSYTTDSNGEEKMLLDASGAEAMMLKNESFRNVLLAYAMQAEKLDLEADAIQKEFDKEINRLKLINALLATLKFQIIFGHELGVGANNYGIVYQPTEAERTGDEEMIFVKISFGLNEYEVNDEITLTANFSYIAGFNFSANADINFTLKNGFSIEAIYHNKLVDEVIFTAEISYSNRDEGGREEVTSIDKELRQTLSEIVVEDELERAKYEELSENYWKLCDQLRGAINKLCNKLIEDKEQKKDFTKDLAYTKHIIIAYVVDFQLEVGISGQLDLLGLIEINGSIVYTRDIIVKIGGRNLVDVEVNYNLVETYFKCEFAGRIAPKLGLYFFISISPIGLDDFFEVGVRIEGQIVFEASGMIRYEYKHDYVDNTVLQRLTLAGGLNIYVNADIAIDYYFNSNDKKSVTIIGKSFPIKDFNAYEKIIEDFASNATKIEIDDTAYNESFDTSKVKDEAKLKLNVKDYLAESGELDLKLNGILTKPYEVAKDEVLRGKQALRFLEKNIFNFDISVTPDSNSASFMEIDNATDTIIFDVKAAEKFSFVIDIDLKPRVNYMYICILKSHHRTIKASYTISNDDFKTLRKITIVENPDAQISGAGISPSMNDEFNTTLEIVSGKTIYVEAITKKDYYVNKIEIYKVINENESEQLDPIYYNDIIPRDKSYRVIHELKTIASDINIVIYTEEICYDLKVDSNNDGTIYLTNSEFVGIDKSYANEIINYTLVPKLGFKLLPGSLKLLFNVRETGEAGISEEYLNLDDTSFRVPSDVSAYVTLKCEFVVDEDYVDSSGLRYTLTSRGTYAVDSYVGRYKRVEIPKYYRGIVVDTINDNFLRGSVVTDILIPNTIINISPKAFNAKSYVNYSFEDGSIYSLDCDVLYRRMSNDKRMLVKYFGSDKEFTIPDNVEVIGDYAFLNTSLEKIIISSGVLEISGKSFVDNYKLLDIDVSKNSSFSFENGKLMNKGKTEIIKYLVSNEDTLVFNEEKLLPYAIDDYKNLKAIINSPIIIMSDSLARSSFEYVIINNNEFEITTNSFSADTQIYTHLEYISKNLKGYYKNIFANNEWYFKNDTPYAIKKYSITFADDIKDNIKSLERFALAESIVKLELREGYDSYGLVYQIKGDDKKYSISGLKFEMPNNDIVISGKVFKKATFAPTYTINPDNETCTITGYIGNHPLNSSDLVIPEYIDGYRVVALANQALSGYYYNKLTLPDTLESIGSSVFGYSVSDLIIPENVSYIGKEAFRIGKDARIIIKSKSLKVEMNAFSDECQIYLENISNNIKYLDLLTSRIYYANDWEYVNGIPTLNISKHTIKIEGYISNSLNAKICTIPSEIIRYDYENIDFNELLAVENYSIDSIKIFVDPYGDDFKILVSYLSDFHYSEDEIREMAKNGIEYNYYEGILALPLSFTLRINYEPIFRTCEDDYIYEESGDSLYVKGYIGNDKDIKLPTSYKGKSVIGISKLAFTNTLVERVFIPAEYNMIQGGAFNNSVIKNIILDEGNKEYILLDNALFDKKNALISVIGKTVSNEALDGVSTIKSYALAGLNNENLQITAAVVEDFAFLGMINLKTATIGPSVRSINGASFYGCNSLGTIITLNNLRYKAVGNILYGINEDNSYASLILIPANIKTNTTILDTLEPVKEVSAYSISNLRNLTGVYLPKDSKVADNAIIGNKSLWISYEGSQMDSMIAKNNISVTHIEASSSKFKLDNGLVYEVTDGVGRLVFAHSSLTNANVASSVLINEVSYDIKAIDDYVFTNCRNLMTINVPKNVIPNYYAFYGMGQKELAISFEADSVDIWNNTYGTLMKFGVK